MFFTHFSLPRFSNSHVHQSSQSFYHKTYILSMFTFLLLLTCVCYNALAMQSYDSYDILYYESLIRAINYVSLTQMKETIEFMESKLIWMIGHHHHRWSYARRCFVTAMHERLRTVSRIPISIDLPDSCTFRAIHFQIHSDYPNMIFAFNSRRRNGPSFTIDTANLQEEMAMIWRRTRNQEGVVLDGTMLIMLHPNGVGVQIMIDGKELMTNSNVNLMKLGKSTMDITIYQNFNVSSVTDMYCLTPNELCAQYPAGRGKWTEIQVRILGKSLWDPAVTTGLGRRDTMEILRQAEEHKKKENVRKSRRSKPMSGTVDIPPQRQRVAAGTVSNRWFEKDVPDLGQYTFDGLFIDED